MAIDFKTRFESLRAKLPSLPSFAGDRTTTRIVLVVVGVLVLINIVFMWYWSRQPDLFWVADSHEPPHDVVGYATTSTLIGVANTLLEKPGGYLSNDIMPPGVLLDNIPNWEYGVLRQIRDLARVLRDDYSRSQSQSLEQPELAQAEELFRWSSERWLIPTPEGKYRQAIEKIETFQGRLVDASDPNTQFFARADNLREWLAVVEKRLGDLSQQLSASVGQRRVNIDLAGEPAAEGATPVPEDVVVKTPWDEIDDVFFEARGSAWALVHFLRAAQFDFAEVLKDKNAEISLRQVIRELEASLRPIRSPIIMNGSGFGMFANHSLVMAGYMSRANAAIIDLRELLTRG